MSMTTEPPTPNNVSAPAPPLSPAWDPIMHAPIPVSAPVVPSVMTTTAVVPPVVQLAAKRAFLRTLTRGYAGAIPAGGVTAAVLLSIPQMGWQQVAASAGAWVLAPIISAFASWLSILSNGVPPDYTNVVSTIATGE